MSNFKRLTHLHMRLLVMLLLLVPCMDLLPPTGVYAAGSQVVAWGGNGAGQTEVPAGLDNVKMISAGGAHNLALRNNGTVVGWGADRYGQATVPGGLTNVLSVAAGGLHSVALQNSGTVVAWGFDEWGQANVPAGLGDVSAIAAGGGHTLAVLEGGTVVAWGLSDAGQADVPAGLTGVIALAAGESHSVALRADGTVVAWGGNYYGQADVPNGLSNVVAIACGNNHTVALREDGTVVAWGLNEDGQTDVPPWVIDIAAIAAGGAHTVAVSTHGTVFAWGDDGEGQTEVPWDLARVGAVAAGNAHTVALIPASAGVTSLSRVNGSPTNYRTIEYAAIFDQPVKGLDETNFTLVTTGSLSGAAIESVDGSDWAWYVKVNTGIGAGTLGLDLTSDVGTVPALTNLPFQGEKYAVNRMAPIANVVAWGNNWAGQTDVPPWLAGVKGIAAGAGHTVVLKPDGTVIAWGDNDEGQIDVPAGITNVRAVAAGSYHTVALRDDGTVVAWGSNREGQTDVPAGLGEVIAIAAGGGHCVALQRDGTVRAWGMNNVGQADVPAGLTDVIALAAGGSHTVALRRNGTLVAWGNNGDGQTDIPGGLTSVAAVSAGGAHTAALKSDGTVVAWGLNGNGQATVPEGLRDVVAIGAGDLHTIALRQDGTVVNWGANLNGELDVPAGLGGVVDVAAGSGFSVALTRATMPSSWYDSGWAYRVPIRIKAERVDTDLANFPVLITGANMPAEFFATAQEDGSDILVTAADGVTRLKREVVNFDPAQQELELYVRIPVLGSANDTTIYLYFGSPTADFTNDADTWDDDYVMVQHMDDATPTTIRDSTVNQFTGHKGNVSDSDPTYQVNPSVEQDGLNGKAQAFDHSWIDMGVHDEFNLRNRFTVEILAYPTERDRVYNTALVAHDLVETGRQWDAPIFMDGAVATLQIETADGEYRVHAPEPDWNAWNHMVTVYNESTMMSILLNGTKYSEAKQGELIDAPDTALLIGTHFKYNWENHPGYFGLIDEVRISKTDRSDAWNRTSQYSLLNPTDFYTVDRLEQRSKVYLPLVTNR